MSQADPGIPRRLIETTIAATREATETGDWDAFVDCFAAEGRFMNSVLPAPIEGREAIRSFAKTWPRVVNREEWRSIDAGRFSIGWNERPYHGSPDDLYRGISTFLFDSGGSIVEYEGVFDVAKVAAVMKRATEEG